MATDEKCTELVELILITSTMEYPLLLLNMYSAVYDDILHVITVMKVAVVWNTKNKVDVKIPSGN